jgi:hypothetical protein
MKNYLGWRFQWGVNLTSNPWGIDGGVAGCDVTVRRNLKFVVVVVFYSRCIKL